jgi:RNA polymerase sigma-70 factor, ECF subfamily
VRAAINSHRVGAAFSRETVVLTRRAARKAQRVASETTPSTGPEHGLRELETRKVDRSSLSEAIRLAQRGDAAAFELIYRLHCGRVYALCLRMLRDSVEAEDLVQEVFIQLFRKIHTFRGESAFSTWLHRLTANLVLMYLRRKRPTFLSLDDITRSEEEDTKPSQEMGAPDPRLSGLIDRVNLQSAIDQLPKGYREIFILYDVHGYEHSEIAKILGRSIGNSKSQLHRARKRLRELLRRARSYGRPESHEATNHSSALVATH